MANLIRYLPVLMILTLLIPTLPAVAQPGCAEYGGGMRWLDRYVPEMTVTGMQEDLGRLYLEGRSNRYWVLDLDAGHPSWVMGTFQIPGVIGSTVVYNQKLYAAHYDVGIDVYSVGTASEARHLITYEAPDIYSIAVEEGRVFTSSVEGVFRCYAGSGPTSLELQWEFTQPESYRFLIHGDVAYLWGSGREFHVLDFSDPTAPRLVATRSCESTPRALSASSDHLFVKISSGVRVYAITDPQHPVLAESLQINSRAIDALGDRLFVRTMNEGVGVWRVGEPRVLQWEGQVGSPFSYTDLVFTPWTAIALSWRGLEILDLEGRSAPGPVATLEINDRDHTLRVSGDLAFLLDGRESSISQHWVRVLDVSDPLRLQVLARIRTRAIPYDAVTIGRILWVLQNDWSEEEGRLTILDAYDLTEPRRPVHVGGLVLPHGDGREMVAVGSLICIVFPGPDEIGIIDASDPHGPELIRILALDSWGGCLAAQGSRLYCGRFEGLDVLDLTVPRDPVTLGTLPAPGHLISALAVEGDLLVASDSTNELWTIDVSDPSLPTRMGGLAMETSVTNIHLRGGRAVTGGSALRILDVSDPWRPLVLDGAPAFVENAFLLDDAILTLVEGALAGDAGDLQVFPLPCEVVAVEPPAPETPPSSVSGPGLSIVSVAPNPSHGGTEVAFRLGTPEFVEVSVVDLRGRVVRRLAAEPMRAGPHAVVWDGRGDDGEIAPAGTYLLRLRGESGLQSRRVGLLR